MKNEPLHPKALQPELLDKIDAYWRAANYLSVGQTNFRTPGGGFAPVYTTTEASAAACRGCHSGDSHASYVFLLDRDGEAHPLAHSLYVAQARGDATAPGWAGATLRLADWYVRLKDGEPDVVVNETYSLMRFDLLGRVDWAATPSTHPHRTGVERVAEDAAWRTETERERMKALLFPPAGLRTCATLPSREAGIPSQSV